MNGDGEIILNEDMISYEEPSDERVADKVYEHHKTNGQATADIFREAKDSARESLSSTYHQIRTGCDAAKEYSLTCIPSKGNLMKAAIYTFIMAGGVGIGAGDLVVGVPMTACGTISYHKILNADKN